jgi:hypothetical protein
MVTMICNKCGWAHFGVSKEYAQKSTDEFIEYYQRMSYAERKRFYGETEITKLQLLAKYEHCFNCSRPYSDFHEETKEDRVPLGVTIQPIVSTHPDAA